MKIVQFNPIWQYLFIYVTPAPSRATTVIWGDLGCCRFLCYLRLEIFGLFFLCIKQALKFYRVSPKNALNIWDHHGKLTHMKNWENMLSYVVFWGKCKNVCLAQIFRFRPQKWSQISRFKDMRPVRFFSEWCNTLVTQYFPTPPN